MASTLENLLMKITYFFSNVRQRSPQLWSLVFFECSFHQRYMRYSECHGNYCLLGWSPLGCWTHQQERCQGSPCYWIGLMQTRLVCLGVNPSLGILIAHCNHQFHICPAHWHQRCTWFGPKCEPWLCQVLQWWTKSGLGLVGGHHQVRQRPKQCRNIGLLCQS